MSAADLQRVVSRGIDPKFLRSVTIGDSGKPSCSFRRHSMFHIDGKGHLVAWSTLEGGKQIAHRKLDGEFAADMSRAQERNIRSPRRVDPLRQWKFAKMGA